MPPALATPLPGAPPHGSQRAPRRAYNAAMRKAHETMLRNLAMLQTIPVHPRTRSTQRIGDELRARNPEYDVTDRTLQRSLDRLSVLFPIACEARGRANHWFWTDRDALTQIPAMSESTAFVLRMAAEHLQPIMPPSALRRLEPYFRHADRVLQGTALGRWPEKAAIIGQGPPLEPPAILDEVQEAVYLALMNNRQVKVVYSSRSQPGARTMVLNPLGIVARSGLVYLVATADGYDDIRHFVLHRMSRPELLDSRSRTPAGFSLSRHVGSDRQFSYPRNPGTLELQAAFEPRTAVHLRESRLARDHRAADMEDGRVLVEATVADTADLRWWLLGFGSAVEVLGPESLRAEFREQAKAMRALYA